MALDVLIVGGGLAGRLLAWRLQKAGRSVLVVDAPAEPALSLSNGAPAWSVAAGLAAPVAGQRATLLPDAAAHLATARTCYGAIEAELGVKVWRELPLLRCFTQNSEAERWRRRCEEAAFKPYLKAVDPATLPEAASLKPLVAAFEISGGGHLDVAALVRALQAVQNNRIERFTYDEQSLAAAKQVVFCEGLAHQSNLLFPALPFQPTRGELLELSIPGLSQTRVLYGRHFLIPLGGERFLCGATYDRQDLKSGVTPEGRASLEAGLQELLQLPYEVTGQRCGLRPNILGHQALWQRHPEQPRFWRMNGLGSKGAWWAPKLTAQACNDLLV